MPWIPFFADRKDAEILLKRLNADDEIAFVVPDSPKAVSKIDRFEDGYYSLWHIPSCSLLHVGVEAESCQASAYPTRPYFGVGNSAEIDLRLWLRHQPYSEAERKTLPTLVSWWMQDFDLLPLSSFGRSSQKVPEPTKRYWRRLKAFVAREAIALAYPRQTFWAFPSAFEKLKGGMRYYANNFNLTEAIQTTEARKS